MSAMRRVCERSGLRAIGWIAVALSVAMLAFGIAHAAALHVDPPADAVAQASDHEAVLFSGSASRCVDHEIGMSCLGAAGCGLCMVLPNVAAVSTGPVPLRVALGPWPPRGLANLPQTRPPRPAA